MSVKNEISTKLLDSHGPRCVYCERDLIGLTPEMDHFAHKAVYPVFTFVTVNIFYSCGFCNSPDRKGQQNTISTFSARYRNCVFSIVHPYFHNPDHHIVYADTDRVNYDMIACSDLGRRTIEFFSWDDIMSTMVRSRDLTKQRLNPMTNAEERKLINECIAYRKKL